VVGGVAVILHGGGRATSDIDILSSDQWETHLRLEDSGFVWSHERRAHQIDALDIHMVTPEMFGRRARVEHVRGVLVVHIADLVSSKLAAALTRPLRHIDLVHVIDLIGRVPLGRSFASKLSLSCRGAFRDLVDQVHGVRGNPAPPLSRTQFFARHGSARRRAAI
jgi:hypothetical protein